jgi:hypothetical protein
VATRTWSGVFLDSNPEAALNAQNTAMLLKPNKRIMTEYQALLSFNINHKKIKPIRMARRKGKARPSMAITHELVGLTYGAKQESK